MGHPLKKEIELKFLANHKKRKMPAKAKSDTDFLSSSCLLATHMAVGIADCLVDFGETCRVHQPSRHAPLELPPWGHCRGRQDTARLLGSTKSKQAPIPWIISVVHPWFIRGSSVVHPCGGTNTGEPTSWRDRKRFGVTSLPPRTFATGFRQGACRWTMPRGGGISFGHHVNEVHFHCQHKRFNFFASG